MGGSGKKSFSGLGDCIVKTMKGPGGFLALYTGFGVSVVGIVGYRGLQLGCFDTVTGLNPYKKDKGLIGAVSTFAAAQTAITIGAGATYPFDTVRRRLQMQRSLWRNTSTREQQIASGRLPRRKAWPLVCTRDSWQMWCAVW